MAKKKQLEAGDPKSPKKELVTHRSKAVVVWRSLSTIWEWIDKNMVHRGETDTVYVNLNTTNNSP